MKKILLIFSLLLLTGCYDYRELNDNKIVSSLIIDYKADKYVVNLEILNTSETASAGSNFIEASGKNFLEALENAKSGIDGEPFYSNMNALFISKDLANKGIDNILDGFARNIEIRKDFYIFIAEDIDRLLEYSPIPRESLGAKVKKNYNTSLEKTGLFNTSQFRDVLYSYLRDETFMLASVDVKDDNIFLEDNYVFKNVKLNTELDNYVAIFKNMFKGQNKTFLFGGEEAYEIHEYKLKADVKKGKITLSLTGLAKLKNMVHSDSLSDKDLDSISKDISNKLKKKLEDVIDYSIKNDVDVLNFNNIYYLHYPKDVTMDTWKNLNYDVKVDIKIGEKVMLMDSLESEKNEK